MTRGRSPTLSSIEGTWLAPPSEPLIAGLDVWYGDASDALVRTILTTLNDCSWPIATECLCQLSSSQRA